MATSAKLLAEAVLGTTEGIVGAAVPVGKEWIVSSVTVCNITASAATFRLGWSSGGGAIGNFWDYFDATSEVGNPIAAERGFTAAAGDELRGLASALTTVVVKVYGVERDPIT